jgi:hypothetical protein
VKHTTPNAHVVRLSNTDKLLSQNNSFIHFIVHLLLKITFSNLQAGHPIPTPHINNLLSVIEHKQHAVFVYVGVKNLLLNDVVGSVVPVLAHKQLHDRRMPQTTLLS